MELPGGVFPGIIRVQGSPFRVGKRRVRDINHEGHEEHPGAIRYAETSSIALDR